MTLATADDETGRHLQAIGELDVRGARDGAGRTGTVEHVPPLDHALEALGQMSSPGVEASSRPLAIAQRSEQSAVVLTADGALDANNSAEFRDSIMKATFDEPAAVIVDVSTLQVANDAAWSVLISARWQFETRPEVPILLVSSNRSAREAITRSGVARFMPVFPTEKGALKAVAKLTRRKIQRGEAKLPANLTSLRESRKLVREWLTSWSKPGLIPVALVVVNVFIENVLEHTGSDPVLRIEVEGPTATIAISDASGAPAVRLASPPKGIDVSGLAIVDALSRAWGSVPTSSGKTVWAIIGPENQL